MTPGSANGDVALLIIDMLEYFATEGDDAYQARFASLVLNIAALKEEAAALGAHPIYVNTQFQSEQEFATSPMARRYPPRWIHGSREADVVTGLAPAMTDIVVTKTVNSGFYGTRLDEVLLGIGARRVVLAGVHTHVCIALTAADAFYRNLDVYVVRDCVATIDPSRHEFGLGLIDRHFGTVIEREDLRLVLADALDSKAIR
jgi:nicotinamidase-related amidase